MSPVIPAGICVRCGIYSANAVCDECRNETSFVLVAPCWCSDETQFLADAEFNDLKFAIHYCRHYKKTEACDAVLSGLFFDSNDWTRDFERTTLSDDFVFAWNSGYHRYHWWLCSCGKKPVESCHWPDIPKDLSSFVDFYLCDDDGRFCSAACYCNKPKKRPPQFRIRVEGQSRSYGGPLAVQCSVCGQPSFKLIKYGRTLNPDTRFSELVGKFRVRLNSNLPGLWGLSFCSRDCCLLAIRSAYLNEQEQRKLEKEKKCVQDVRRIVSKVKKCLRETQTQEVWKSLKQEFEQVATSQK